MLFSEVELIYVRDSARWKAILSSMDAYDFYHLPEYHTVAESEGEGKGVLFVYKESNRIAACPFLVRPLETVMGLEGVGSGLFDATSVYGYAGPVYNAEARYDLKFKQRFAFALQHTAREMNIVSLFSRMHPLLNNAMPDAGNGTLKPMGETISIDLLESNNEQWLGFRKSHRYEIKKALAKGVHVFRDHGWEKYDDFIHLYTATMKRVRASRHYFFSRNHFAQMQQALGDRLHLFVAEFEGEVCSASLFVHTGLIIQYHLSGSNALGRKLAAAKAIVNEARLWGKEIGAHVLHLGGGVGAKRDGLFSFKQGFSQSRHKFFVWDLIIEHEAYWALVQARRKWFEENHTAMPRNDFFPLYRAEGTQESLTV